MGLNFELCATSLKRPLETLLTSVSIDIVATLAS